MVSVSLVAGVARSQHTDPRVALDRLIADALAAEGARATGQDRDPSTARLLESIIARSTTEHIQSASRAAGPPTDAEVAELTASYWRDVDLPEQVKVIHAVVVHPKDRSQDPAARALAAQLASSLAGAKSEDDFEARAKAFPHGTFEIIVERLPAFVQDGRTAEEAPMFLDPAFVRAAFGLKKPGDTSGVIESSSGWHAIRLVERRPPKSVPLEERRARFSEEIYARRAHGELEDVLSARRSATHVEIERDADALMAAASSSASP